jgi:formylglycine-generating enzyme required for sulfatase activity
MAAVAAVLLLLAASVGVGLYIFKRSASNPSNASGSEESSGEARATDGAASLKQELIEIPGGSFQMGSAVGSIDETPVHAVTVNSFAMDKTEVTLGEYGEFLRETGHAPPANWPGGKLTPEQQSLPVTDVSLQDAKDFASWRSQRDGVLYRLPTEEEWEYAARGGTRDSLYPWGNTWLENRAATKETGVISPRAVGSYPLGKTRWGCLDMIGNAWEWTSSTIAMYPGNDKASVPGDQQDWIVIRGGSFTSEGRGGKGVTATTRKWVEATRKDPLLGFRLVRQTS